MQVAAVQQIRSFNRTVAESIGALDDHFLGQARPLGEARVLWEIGTNGAEIRKLRERLNLDSGYLSRILRSLEQQGLVFVRASAGDGRVREAYLTETGLTERAELDHRSDNLALRILESLSDRQRATLVGAMTEVERLLQASMVRFAIEDPTSADAQWCLEQYFAELNERYDEGFDPTLTLSVDAREITPPAGAWLVARLRDRPVGCGAIKFHGDNPAELKRIWISQVVRGLGLGRRLLSELERYAREAGVTIVRLDTNRVLSEAIALYRSSGYIEVAPYNAEPYAHHWFEKRLD